MSEYVNPYSLEGLCAGLNTTPPPLPANGSTLRRKTQWMAGKSAAQRRAKREKKEHEQQQQEQQGMGAAQGHPLQSPHVQFTSQPYRQPRSQAAQQAAQSTSISTPLKFASFSTSEYHCFTGSSPSSTASASDSIASGLLPTARR